jgi:amidohydrolase
VSNNDVAGPDVRAQLAQEIEQRADELTALSQRIHDDPELAFEERHASEEIAATLARAGFAVDRGVGQFPTALVGTAGKGELVVGICAEYDALPEVGHACGHNLITGASVGAALALATRADQLGITVKLIGTPAEEHGAGKVKLLEAGTFDDVACAMMVHMLPEQPTFNPLGTTTQAVGRFRVEFTGKSSHAAAAPHLGVNAADAAVVAQVAIGLLRQQIPGDQRVALYVAEAGNVTNIIPERAVVHCEMRAYTMPEFGSLRDRVFHCFEAGALATGCQVHITPTEPIYEPLIHDERMGAAWVDAMATLGRKVELAKASPAGSTDMGNVSQYMPALHPWVGLPGVACAIHSVQFAETARSPGAYAMMLEAATAMAWTVAQIATDPDDREHFLTLARERQPYMSTRPGSDRKVTA